MTSLVIDAVRRRQPEREIVGFSLDPEDTRARHGLAAGYGIVSRPPHRSSDGRSPRGWQRIVRGLRRRAATLLREPGHLLRSYRALRDVDELVIAGSGQLLDTWSGFWGHPYTILKWALLARLAHTETLFLSVGAGPLERPLARRAVRYAVEHARYVSVRDSSSALALRAAGVTRPLPVVPDMAFALAPPTRPPSEGDRPRVGVNAMAQYSARYWGTGDHERYDDYIRKVARLVEATVAGGADVTLFTSQVRADPGTAADVIAELASCGPEVNRHVRWQPVADVDGLLSVIAECDEVIASRYHCVLLPLVMGIPTIGLAYHPKTQDLMEMLGLRDYCTSIDSFEPGQTVALLHRLRHHRQTVRQELAARIPEQQRAVQDQFDRVFPRTPVAARRAGTP